MISVIVPVYNVEKYLEACINSVINQTYQDWELILVNDGSTDSSMTICQKFAHSDSRIKIFSQENKGQAAARNFGLQQATRLYVTFLDADDEIASNTLQDNLAILKTNPQIDCLQYPTYMDYGTEQQFIRSSKQQLIDSDFYERWLNDKYISWIVCDKIFKTSIFDRLRFTEGIIYEDNLLIANLLERINNIYISTEGLYYYYLRENSTMTSSHSLKKEQDSFYVTSQIADKLLKHNEKELLIEFVLRLINIKKSLRVNFSQYEHIPSYLVRSISSGDIFFSKTSIKNKVKLLLEKYIKYNYYLPNRLK